MDVTEGGNHKIEVGDITFYNMYLYSYSFSDTPSSKTLTVNFVDQSICLDKIFVGLPGRHGTQTGVNDEVFFGYDSFGGWNFYNPSSTVQVTAFSQTYEFRLMCLECNSLRPRKYIRPTPEEPPQKITRMAYMAGDGKPCPNTMPRNTHIKVKQGQPCVDGGYMLIGKEGFTETPCEIPKVEYTFDELCDALDWILGADPKGCIQESHRHNLREFKRSATYEASYTGNLREVLSAWGADFSFDFSFDYSKPDPEIVGISLEEPVDLEPVKDAIKLGFGADSDSGLIRNITETHTLENTYKQSPLVKYIKPPRPFLRNQKHYAKAVGKVLKLEDAVGNRANLGRSWEELYASVALAKYQPQARLTWLSDLARQKWSDPNWVNPDAYPVPCKECPDWDGPRNVWPVGTPLAGQKKYTSEYQCIKDGAGLGKDIPNNASLPGETWYNYGAAAGGVDAWGKAKIKAGAGAGLNEQWNYNHPTLCLEKMDHLPAYYCQGPVPKNTQVAPVVISNPLLVKNSSQRPGWQNPSWRIDVPWMSLGFFPEKRILDHNLKAKLLTIHRQGLEAGKNKKPFAHPIWDKPENYDLFVGIWNKAFQQKVEEYDRDVADNFLGKYGWWYGNRTNEEELALGIPPNFGPVNPPASIQQCPKWLFDYEAGQKHRTYMYKFDVETSPESNVYSGNSYPFVEVLKVNDYVFGDNGSAPIGDDSDPCTLCPERAIFQIEDNAWGTSQEIIDDLFSNKYIVNYPYSAAFVNPESLVAMSDIGEYVPYYTPILQDRMIRQAYADAGVPQFESEVYRPEDHPSGYFPGFAFIPNMDRATGVGGSPILKVDYDHWSCPLSPPAPPPSPTDFCMTGCPPPTCGDAGAPAPPNCIEPCWDCLKSTGKQYGTLRSAGAPAGTTYPWGPIETGGNGSNPNYEPQNPAWAKCLVMACAEDYGYCVKDHKTVGYPTARENDDGIMLPAMDKAACEALPDQYVYPTSNGGVPCMGPAQWQGADSAADCVANPLSTSIGIKVSINDDPNACACWECSLNNVGQGVFFFGEESAAADYCNAQMSLVQKDELTITAGSGTGGITVNIPTVPPFGVLVPAATGGTDDQNNINTAAQIVLATQAHVSGFAGASVVSFGTNVVTFTFPLGILTNNGKVTASAQPDAGVTTTSTQGQAIQAVRVLTSAGCPGEQGPEGPCPTNTYLKSSEIINEQVYDNTRRRKMQWAADNATPADCTLWCEEDIVKTVCGCDPPKEPIHHFSNYRARYLKITHLNITKKIIFPIEHDYRGFWMSDATEKGYYPRKQIVLGTPPTSEELNAANVMETRIVDADVTQDLDTIEMGGDNGAPGAYQEQLVVSNPYNLDSNNVPIPEVVSLPTYYTFMRSVSKSADKPNETINLKVDGTEFDKLTDLLTPAKGLSGFTVSVGSDGISTDLTYLSRPAKLPKRDVLLQKIGPRAIEGRIPKPSIDSRLNDWNIK
jgi:hypothetical protein